MPTSDDEETSDPRRPLPSYSIDEDASDLMDAPCSSTLHTTSPPCTMTKTITPHEDDMKNTDDPALPGEDPPPPPPKKKRRVPLASILLVAIAIASAATWWALRR